jgi:hypothetical protein
MSWAQLTTDTPSVVGALWWNAAYTFDAFDMSATIWIQAKPNGADGLGFAWVAGNDLSAVGTGGHFGAGNLPGYVVAIDTWQDPGEPAAPNLVLFDGMHAEPPYGRYTIPNIRDGQNHRLRVMLASGTVSVWIDGINYVPNFALPGYKPIVGHWGFTGGTGSASEAHWVKDITMSFPNGQGCVP